MNFGFTEEQELLRAEVRKFLDESCPMEGVRKISASPPGYSAELWKRTSELGWAGLTIPEVHGGAGLGFVDLVVLLEETGRTLYPSPLIATTLAATAIQDAGSEEQQARWLPSLAAGQRIGTVALLEASDVLGPAGVTLEARREGDGLLLTGEKRFVPDGHAADLFVVACRTGRGPDDMALVVVERGAAGLTTENLPCIDETKRLGRIRLEGVRVKRDAVLAAKPGTAALTRLLDRGAAAVTAEMIGAAEGALALTVRYAKERLQFGSPIGRYQGVKHPLAEIYVDVESAKSLLYFAAWTLDENPEEAPRAVSMAKAYATEAFSRLGLDVVQLHGGIGYTWEYDAQLYLKRSKWARPAFGDADHHYERAAALGGL
jgi:alkylation response protein AidB-like acyl-CoA dehydrogenase